MARRPFQLLKTAPTPPHSCSMRLVGERLPRTSCTLALNCSQSFFRSSADRSVSLLYALGLLAASMMCSSCTRMPWPSAGSMPSAFSITTSEYIMIKRR